MTTPSQARLHSPPTGFISALEHNTGSLYAGSITGELRVYNTACDDPPLQWLFEDPVLGIAFFENKVFVLHPTRVSLYNGEFFDTIDKLDLEQQEGEAVVYQCIKIDQDSNLLVLGTNNGSLVMYNLPDLGVIDRWSCTSGDKLQMFDMFNYHLVAALSSGSNILFDISNKKFFQLTVQESGFKYPLTTDLKFLHDDNDTTTAFNNTPPYQLVYAQAGIEGKVSVITTLIEQPTDPTVTINTAAKMAPVSSCMNPSGLAVNDDNTVKFIFKAHRSTLKEKDSVMIGPIYSLQTWNGALVTSGYTVADKGCICLWDVSSKKRLRMTRGLPGTVVRMCVIDDNNLVCGCSDDVYRNSPVGGSLLAADESSLVVLTSSTM